MVVNRVSPTPMPRDPSAPRVVPEELSARVEAILAEPAATLREEAQLLGRAHAVLNDALRND